MSIGTLKFNKTVVREYTCMTWRVTLGLEYKIHKFEEPYDNSEKCYYIINDVGMLLPFHPAYVIVTLGGPW